MYRVISVAVALAFAAAAFAAAPARAAVQPYPQASVASLLGPDVKGDNWTVAPVVKSDGFLWIFSVKTPYGDFQVNGLRRMRDRAQELRALSALEKMSRTKAFGDALAHAGMAPIRFGRDLILDPVETTGNFVSGVGKMFNSVVSGVKNRGKGRDPFFDNVLGVTKAERDLAAGLKVDPYTDFTPLRAGLEDVAQVIAAGDLTVTAALSAIPGGAGIAVGASSTASQVADAVYTKTALELGQIVTKKIEGLGVDEATTKTFVDNTYYSPADTYAIADALEKLGAANASAFITRANSAESYDVAKFYRFRAELLARDNAGLGTIKEFVLISDSALNHDASGRLIAAFPFDLVSWTDTVSKSLTRLSSGVTAAREVHPRVFDSTGSISPMAAAELKKQGWAVMSVE